MKWKVLALINFVWSFGYAAEQINKPNIFYNNKIKNQSRIKNYWIELKDDTEMFGSKIVPLTTNFINSFDVLKNMYQDLGDLDKTVFTVPNLDKNKFDLLHNLLKEKTEEAVKQNFNRLALQDQSELLKIIDFLAPQNTLLGTFEYRSNNHLVKAFVSNLHQQIDQELLDEFNQDEFIKKLVINNLQLIKWWEMGQRLGAVDNRNQAAVHTGSIKSVAVLQDGKMVVTGALDNTAIVWRQNERGQWVMGQRLGVVNNPNQAAGHTSMITSVAVSRDGSMIVTGSADRTAIMWNLVDGLWVMGQRLGVVKNENEAAGHTDWIYSVAVSQDGGMIVTGSQDDTAIVWNLVNGEWVIDQRLGGINNRKQVVGHTSSISSVAVSQDGGMIVTGSVDSTVIVWRQNERGEWVIGQRLGEVNNKNENLGHVSVISSVAVSRDARMIVTGSFDSTAIVWKEVDFVYILNVEEIAEWFVKKRLAKYQARLERERLEREANLLGLKLNELLQANNIQIDLLLDEERENLEKAIKFEQDTTAIILMIQQRLENEVWQAMSAIIQSGSLEEAFDNEADFSNNRVKRKEQHRTELDSDSDEEVDPRDKRKDTKNKG